MRNKILTEIYFILFVLLISLVAAQENKINCTKEKYFVGEYIDCIGDCNSGAWFIVDKIGKPINDSLIIDIPPNSLRIGPIKEEGIIALNLICYQPSGYYQKDIIIEKGVALSCPKECKTEDICACETKNCTKGLLTLRNLEQNPLESDIFKFVYGDIKVNFTSKAIGLVGARLDCFEPYQLIRETNIKIIKSCRGSISLTLKPNFTYVSKIVEASVSGLIDCENKTISIRRYSCKGIEVCNTTQNSCTFFAPSEEGKYSYYACIDKNDDGDTDDIGENAFSLLDVDVQPENLKVANLSCDEIKGVCSLNVYENTINDSVVIFMFLIEEPIGIIYYLSNLNMERYSTGEKISFLSPVAECTEGKELKILALAYRLSDFKNRLLRIKTQGFIC
jgi:hypothetical protein